MLAAMLQQMPPELLAQLAGAAGGAGGAGEGAEVKRLAGTAILVALFGVWAVQRVFQR